MDGGRFRLRGCGFQCSDGSMQQFIDDTPRHGLDGSFLFRGQSSHFAAYTVDFADFPEIITSGATLAKAFANACEALDLHLESIQKLGRRSPKPRHALVVQST